MRYIDFGGLLKVSERQHRQLRQLEHVEELTFGRWLTGGEDGEFLVNVGIDDAANMEELRAQVERTLAG